MGWGGEDACDGIHYILYDHDINEARLSEAMHFHFPMIGSSRPALTATARMWLRKVSFIIAIIDRYEQRGRSRSKEALFVLSRLCCLTPKSRNSFKKYFTHLMFTTHQPIRANLTFVLNWVELQAISYWCLCKCMVFHLWHWHTDNQRAKQTKYHNAEMLSRGFIWFL